MKLGCVDPRNRLVRVERDNEQLGEACDDHAWRDYAWIIGADNIGKIL